MELAWLHETGFVLCAVWVLFGIWQFERSRLLRRFGSERRTRSDRKADARAGTSAPIERRIRA
jgi:hypothetical protein